MELTTREYMTILHTLEATLAEETMPSEKDRIEVVNKLNEVTIIPTISIKVGDSNVLTSREKEVLKLISRGLTGKEIGEKLFMSTSTVKRTVSNILVSLQATSRAHAIGIARDQGIV